MVDTVPSPFEAPPAKVVMDGSPGREIQWQHAPGTAAPEQVEDGVDYRTRVDLTGSPARLGWRDQWLNQSELSIGETRRVEALCPGSALHPVGSPSSHP